MALVVRAQSLCKTFGYTETGREIQFAVFEAISYNPHAHHQTSTNPGRIYTPGDNLAVIAACV